MRNLPSFSAWTGGASRPDAYRAFSLERDGESHIAESRHGRHNVSGLYSVQIQSKDRSECQFSLYPERQWNRQLSRRQLRAPTVLGNSSEAINERYSHLGSTTRDSCFAWIDPFIDDAHIHFNFNKIYLQDNELWDWSLYGSDPRDQSSALNQLRNEINQNPNIPLGICVFFTENSDAYDRYLNAIVEGTEVDILHESFAYSSFPDVSTIPRIHMPDTYQNIYG